MTALRKYQFFLIGTALLFLYLLSTEVVDRYADLWKVYRELEAKRENSRDPEALAAERDQLLARQRKLKELLRGGSVAFEQSRTGVLEFVNHSATKATVKLESLVPVKQEAQGHGEVLGFRLSCTAPVHHVGLFLNLLENGPFSLRLSKLDVSREGVSPPAVKATMEGTVHLAL